MICLRVAAKIKGLGSAAVMIDAACQPGKVVKGFFVCWENNVRGLKDKGMLMDVVILHNGDDMLVVVIGEGKLHAGTY